MATTTDVARLLQATETPIRFRKPARFFAVVMLLSALCMVGVPWRQNAVGQGKVMAFSPVDRQQVIEAPISGRVVRWMVAEGTRVEKDQPLAELSDIDPNYVSQLEANRDAVLQQLAAAQAEAAAYRNKEGALSNARGMLDEAAQLKVQMARQKVEAATQKRDAAEAKEQTAKLNLVRLESLHEEGLSSKRELELAQLKGAEAMADLNTAKAALSEARAMEMSLQAERLQKGSEATAKTASAGALYRKALANEAYAKAALAKINVQLSRQSSRVVKAPRDGFVLRATGGEGGDVVKMGDELAVIVPDTPSRSVELWLDGNDAPLVKPGRQVRLQFEGWPAVQFSGWPSVAVGTFGGRVAFVDALSRRNGQFRVLVVPDEEEQQWPVSDILRQGVKAKGWILLDEVRIGYELWRQVNGFPATASDYQEDSVAGKSKKGDDSGDEDSK